MIIILGGNSQLANHLGSIIKQSIKIIRKDCDITKSRDLHKILEKYKPKYIFNCAAYHDTILCEKNIKKSFQINAYSLEKLSQFANLYKCKLIHFSTDYVFDGKKSKPYIETDYPNPINIYGQSKLLGEYFVRSICKDYLIFRLSSIYSHYPCQQKKGLNFIEKILQLSQSQNELFLNDLKISPTYVGDIALQVNKTYKEIENEVVHCTSLGNTSWYDFAKEILKVNKIKIKVNKVKNFDRDLIKRPEYSVLKNNFLIKNGLNYMPKWRDSYNNYIKDQYLKKTSL